MKWFDHWFYSKVRWAQKRGGTENPSWKDQEDYLDNIAYDRVTLSASREAMEEDAHCLYDGLKIDIKRLNGGYVVTFRHRSDNKSQYVDEMKRNSYIVNSDDNFNEQLGKLITMELLK